MAGATLTLRLQGASEYIPFDSFLEASQNSLEMLRDLDTTISGKYGPTLRWFISNLELGSATVTITAESSLEDVDFGPQVVKAFVDGLEHIEKEASLPAYFSDDTLESAKRLVRILDSDVARISVSSETKLTVITQHVAANVNQIIGAQFDALGSVEGPLEMVTLRGQPYFNVYDAITGRAVRCHFSREMLQEVKDALGRRVVVSGRVRSNPSGEPVSVRVEELRLLRAEEELPKTADIAGLVPDLTEGVSSEEHLRRLRDG